MWCLPAADAKPSFLALLQLYLLLEPLTEISCLLHMESDIEEKALEWAKPEVLKDFFGHKTLFR